MTERQTAGGRSVDSASPESPSIRPGLVRLAIWLGLIAWAAEYAILAFQKFVLNERVVWYVESMWLAAFVYAVVFALFGVALAAVARIGPRARRVAVCVLVGLAALSVMLVFTSIQRLASFLLAAGIGYQIGTLIDRRGAGAARLLRLTFAPLAGATALIVIVLATFQPIREWRAYASLPDAHPGAPNVILLILDTVRASELGLYGYDRGTTPVLDAFAARGVTFDRAISTASWTLPSHFSMLTGLYPHELPPELDATMDRGLPGVANLADVLRENGYATAGFVANMSYMVDESGLDRGFIRWEDHGVNPGQIGISTAPGRTVLANGRLRAMLDWHDFPIRKPAADVNESMLEWIDGQGDRPFFVLANYFDTHNPYLPPPEFESRFVDRRPTAGMRYHPHAAIWWDHVGHSAAELKAQQDMYDGALAWLDSEMDRLFESLETRGLLENTVLIITSDHGEAFGEHGRLGHGANVYHELIHVPLIISFGDRTPGGRRIADEVTLADLPATILDLVDIEKHEVPGQSLATAWDPVKPRVPASPIIAYENTGRAMGSLVLDGWHYIRAPNGREELFDLGSDPTEQRDLASNATFARRLAQMRVAMDSVLAITPGQRLGERADYVNRSTIPSVASSKR